MVAHPSDRESPLPLGGLEASEPTTARLFWLVHLRWVALLGVVVGLGCAYFLRLPFVAPAPLAAAIAIGVLYNLWFWWRLRRLDHGLYRGTLRFELHLHATMDVGALTLLLLSSGGLKNPFSMFYGFHVVLGAMLGRSKGALLSASMSLVGVGLLLWAEQERMLFSAPLVSPPTWLLVCSLVLTILSLGYFSMGALRLLQKEEERGLRNARLLLSGLDALQVGMELVSPEKLIVFSNRRADTLRRAFGQERGPSLPATAGSGLRFPIQEGGETRIYERLPLSEFSEQEGLRGYLYVDRTESTVDDQRAIMLERLASLGRAMHAVAHDLNTPLSTIQTLAVDLSHSLKDADADQSESISLIIDEARRCGEITRELLQSARESPQPHFVHTVLRDVVRRAVRLTFGSRPGQGVNISGDLSASCVTQSDRLLQILVNLLQNARDASPGPEKVEVHLAQSEEEAVIEVSDHGPGLPDTVRERLFQPFVTTKPLGQGTGLGLYTCARLASQLAADLSLLPRPGGGVRARLVLPRKVQEA